MMKHVACITFCVFLCSVPFSQTVVNAYAEVTNVTGTTLTLANVDESGDTFEDGEYLIIMQMQDNVIGSTADNATFGSLGSISNAGLYEVRQILSHTETAGVPTTLTLRSATTNTYSTGANAKLQIITFPTFGAPDYTTTFDMGARAWDGNTGGVLAFNVDGILTLANDLTADERGFRGAGPNAGGSSGCDGGNNYRVATQNNMADKGESIYLNTTGGYDAGMGRMLNGGGGGNSHNGGGGGGGNFTSGGNGGPGWPTCSPSAGGLGGLSLSAHISPTRIFLGGGGGAGEGNNNLSTDGGDGGGIILLRATEVVTSGACGGITISANGQSIAFAGNDGGGGAGAGGSIVIQVDNWNISAGCPISLNASGGDGGGVNSGATHGGGGGGGQGTVIYSISQPTTNTTTTTANGTGGCDNNSNPCTSQAGSGGGSTDDGIIQNTGGPLPVELLNFDAQLFNNDYVRLDWSTASEINSSHFNIERSADGIEWKTIGKVLSAGNSSNMIYYEYVDLNPLAGYSYYRLKQVDLDEKFKYSSIRHIDIDGVQDVDIYPNPTNGIFNIVMNNPTSGYQIFNSIGQEVSSSIEATQSQNLIQLDMSNMAAGIYTIHLQGAYYKLYKQ